MSPQPTTTIKAALNIVLVFQGDARPRRLTLRVRWLDNRVTPDGEHRHKRAQANERRSVLLGRVGSGPPVSSPVTSSTPDQITRSVVAIAMRSAFLAYLSGSGLVNVLSYCTFQAVYASFERLRHGSRSRSDA